MCKLHSLEGLGQHLPPADCQQNHCAHSFHQSGEQFPPTECIVMCVCRWVRVGETNGKERGQRKGCGEEEGERKTGEQETGGERKRERSGKMSVQEHILPLVMVVIYGE